MHKYALLIALVSLLFNCTASAGVGLTAAMQAAPAPSGGSCAVFLTQAGDGSFGFTGLGATANNKSVGLRDWTSTASTDVCKISFRLTLAGTDITGKTYTAKIYAATGCANLSGLAGTSVAVAGVNLWIDTEVEFTFSSPVTIASGTHYFVVLTLESGSVDNANYVLVGTHAAPSITGTFDAWSNAGVVQACNQTAAPAIKIYGQ